MAKTITLNASPSWPGAKNDYVLRFEQHIVGRIRLVETAWEWQITVPMAMPPWAQGVSASLNDARKAVAMAWGRLVKETPPARLDRAWDLARAAEARQPRLEAAGKSDA